MNADLKSVGIADTDANKEWSEDLADDPVDVAIGAGSAWVLTEKGEVLRYDLATHTKTKTITAIKLPKHILFAAGSVWVDGIDASVCAGGAGATVVRIDPATDAVVKNIAVGVTDVNCGAVTSALFADGDASVYAVVEKSFGVVRIDPATSAVTKRMPLDGHSGAEGVSNGVSAGGAVWVYLGTTKSLMKVDPTTLAVVTPTPVPANALAQRMWALGDAVYLVDDTGNLLRVTAAAPATQKTFPLTNSIGDLALREGTLYGFFATIEGPVVAYDPTSLAVTKSTQGLISPEKIAFVP